MDEWINVSIKQGTEIEKRERPKEEKKKIEDLVSIHTFDVKKITRGELTTLPLVLLRSGGWHIRHISAAILPGP